MDMDTAPGYPYRFLFPVLIIAEKKPHRNANGARIRNFRQPKPIPPFLMECQVQCENRLLRLPGTPAVMSDPYVRDQFIVR